MYNKILITTDGSKGSKTAIQHASEVAKKFDAKVHILYIVDVRSGIQGMTEILTNKLEKIGDNVTKEIQEELTSEGVKSTTHVEYGVPNRSILDFAEDKEVDLIVMSTHGRTGIDRILIGSVTEKVIRKSNKPVLTVGQEGF